MCDAENKDNSERKELWDWYEGSKWFGPSKAHVGRPHVSVSIPLNVSSRIYQNLSEQEVQSINSWHHSFLIGFESMPSGLVSIVLNALPLEWQQAVLFDLLLYL